MVVKEILIWILRVLNVMVEESLRMLGASMIKKEREDVWFTYK